MSGLVSRAITGGSESYDAPLTPLRVFNREQRIMQSEAIVLLRRFDGPLLRHV